MSPAAGTSLQLVISTGVFGDRYEEILKRYGAQVTVLDKLTYAGTLTNLAEVAGSPRFRFVEGDVCDADLVKNCTVDFADLGQFKSVFFTNDPDADFNGTASPFSYVAWDQTTGTAGGLADAGWVLA